MRKYKAFPMQNKDLIFTPHYIQCGNGRRIYNRGLSKRYIKYDEACEFLTKIFWEWIRDRTYPWRVLGWEATKHWDRKEVWQWREREIKKYIPDWKEYKVITSTSPFTPLMPLWLQRKTRKALGIIEELGEFLDRVVKATLDKK